MYTKKVTAMVPNHAPRRPDRPYRVFVPAPRWAVFNADDKAVRTFLSEAEAREYMAVAS